MTRATCVLGCLALAAARPVAAQEASVNITHTLIGETHIDNQNGQVDDDDYGLVINRFNLLGSAYGLSASLRVDGETFIERPNDTYQSDLRLERMWGEWAWGDLRFAGGDMYQQLGRGLVLSLRKQDEIGFDAALRGGQVQYAGEDHEAVAFLGITNATNLDAVSQRHQRDLEDFLAGAAYTFRGLEGVALQGYGLYVQPKHSLDDTIAQDWTQNVGGSVQLDLVDGFSFYGEGAWQHREVLGEAASGSAEYLAADVAFFDTTVLVEVLSLAQFDVSGSESQILRRRESYNRPPTLQRLQEEVLNQRDVLGGRLQVSHHFPSIDLTLIANGMLRYEGFYQQLKDPGAPPMVRQAHGWGGGEWYFWEGGGRLNVQAGYRDENQLGRSLKTLWHLDLEALVPMGEGYSLHGTYTHEQRTLGEESSFMRGSAFLGVDKAGLGSLTFELGYDNQRPGTPEEPNRTLFLAGIVGLDVNQHLHLNVIAGTQRGGLKCVDGLCRIYPGFAGVRAEAVARW